MRSHEQLALIASIADDLAVGVWVAAAPDGTFVYANRAFDEIMGMGPVTDVGVGEYAAPYGIFDREGNLYPEDRLPFVQALAARATVMVDDIVIHRRDGRRVYVRALGKPMFDDAGTITHVAIAFFDITREVQAEDARADAEGRLRRVVADAPIVLFAFDREGKITVAEGRGLERLGAAAGEFVGRSVFDLFPDAPVVGEHSRQALRGEPQRYVVDLRGVLYDVRLTPLTDRAGAIAGVLGVATDVTDRHRVEMQLAQAERLASLGMLAAGIAHEINNPLSFVISNLELLARDLDAGGASARSRDAMVREALQGAERVRAIVRELKMFSRADARQPAPMDPRAPLGAAIAIARNEIRHRARLVEDLAPTPFVMGDEGRLAQLFLNLLINAAQAIREGDADANQVRVASGQAANGWAFVEVTDSGEGISPDSLARIFEPFYTTKPHGAGTGIGLAICQAIVAELGGTIDVQSDPGRGSTFRVQLPPAARGGAMVDSGRMAVARPARGRRGAVLVVDDEPLILTSVQRLLGSEHDVTCESRASAALERIRGGERFDAIVCDLMMPEMSGMDLYDRLVQVAPDQARAMLFLTGGAFTPRARTFLERVRGKTIEKPFNAATLGARVRGIVG